MMSQRWFFMKRFLLVLLALTFLTLGLDLAAYKNAQVLGETPVYPVSLEKEADNLALTCFGYTVYIPLP